MKSLCLITELLYVWCEKLWSPTVDTIRRDIIQLDSEMKLRKVRVGAISMGYMHNDSQLKNVYEREKKITIAKKAISLLYNGNVILIHGGTTCIELARMIPEKMSLTCFTLSLPVAIELCKKPKLKVIFIGGELAKETQISSGGEAIHKLSTLKVDYGFLGTGYVDIHHGLTEFDWESVQVKMAVVRASKNPVLLTISEKINSMNRYKTSDLKDISYMITELDPHAPF